MGLVAGQLGARARRTQQAHSVRRALAPSRLVVKGP